MTGVKLTSAASLAETSGVGVYEDKILIICQDRSAALTHLKLFRENHYNASLATTSRAAFLGIMYDKPKIIFLDPLFNGELNVHLINDIRACDKKVKIVLMLDPAFKETIFQHVAQQQISWVLAKPFCADDLCAVARTLLLG